MRDKKIKKKKERIKIKYSKPEVNENGVLAGFRKNILLDRKKVNNEVKSAKIMMNKFAQSIYSLTVVERQFFHKKPIILEEMLFDFKFSFRQTFNFIA